MFWVAVAKIDQAVKKHKHHSKEFKPDKVDDNDDDDQPPFPQPHMPDMPPTHTAMMASPVGLNITEPYKHAGQALPSNNSTPVALRHMKVGTLRSTRESRLKREARPPPSRLVSLGVTEPYKHEGQDPPAPAEAAELISLGVAEPHKHAGQAPPPAELLPLDVTEPHKHAGQAPPPLSTEAPAPISLGITEPHKHEGQAPPAAAEASAPISLGITEPRKHAREIRPPHRLESLAATEPHKHVGQFLPPPAEAAAPISLGITEPHKHQGQAPPPKHEHIARQFVVPTLSNSTIPILTLPQHPAQGILYLYEELEHLNKATQDALLAEFVRIDPSFEIATAYAQLANHDAKAFNARWVKLLNYVHEQQSVRQALQKQEMQVRGQATVTAHQYKGTDVTMESLVMFVKKTLPPHFTHPIEARGEAISSPQDNQRSNGTATQLQQLIGELKHLYKNDVAAIQKLANMPVTDIEQYLENLLHHHKNGTRALEPRGRIVLPPHYLNSSCPHHHKVDGAAIPRNVVETHCLAELSPLEAEKILHMCSHKETHSVGICQKIWDCLAEEEKWGVLPPVWKDQIARPIIHFPETELDRTESAATAKRDLAVTEKVDNEWKAIQTLINATYGPGFNYSGAAPHITPILPLGPGPMIPKNSSHHFHGPRGFSAGNLTLGEHASKAHSTFQPRMIVFVVLLVGVGYGAHWLLTRRAAMGWRRISEPKARENV